VQPNISYYHKRITDYHIRFILGARVFSQYLSAFSAASYRLEKKRVTSLILVGKKPILEGEGAKG
jgi:hypothetical protein